MHRALPLLLLACLSLAQLAVPASIIWRHQAALNHGATLKFRTGLYDPYDPFRGRYVQLQLELSRIALTPEIYLSPELSDAITQRRQAYVSFKPDEDGFATITAIGLKQPESNDLWLRTLVTITGTGDRAIASVRIPFDQYFINEKAASEAERLYFESSQRRRTSEQETIWDNKNYIQVRMHNGTAVTESLFIDGQSIEALLSQNTQ